MKFERLSLIRIAGLKWLTNAKICSGEAAQDYQIRDVILASHLVILDQIAGATPYVLRMAGARTAIQDGQNRVRCQVTWGGCV